MLSLILLDLKKNDNGKRSWQEVVNHFEKDLHWSGIVNEKLKNIEDEEDLWKEIEEELGDKVASSIIIPLL